MYLTSQFFADFEVPDNPIIPWSFDFGVGGLEGLRAGELESWRAGELESWRAGGLEGWRAGELESWESGELEASAVGGFASRFAAPLRSSGRCFSRGFKAKRIQI